jgi:hypothetical protein
MFYAEIKILYRLEQALSTCDNQPHIICNYNFTSNALSAGAMKRDV